MCHPVLDDANLPVFFLAIDRQLAQEAKEQNCPCGGRLHRAFYPRRPRGLEVNDPEFSLRFSFCCDRDGCRRRLTPPSVRFLGPKVYLGVVVVLITAMRQGPSPTGLRTLERHFGVSRRSLKRWRLWWEDIFGRSKFWQEAKARFASPPAAAELPHALVARFDAGASLERCGDLLKFIAPTGKRRLEVRAS